MAAASPRDDRWTLIVRSIVLVAGAVFKESVRDRVPLQHRRLRRAAGRGVVPDRQLTAGQDLKIIKDLGLAALSIFGLLIAVFIGIGLVAKEVERRSIYSLLTKPVTRAQFILGKYSGLVMTLAVNLARDDRRVLRRAAATSS